MSRKLFHFFVVLTLSLGLVLAQVPKQVRAEGLMNNSVTGEAKTIISNAALGVKTTTFSTINAFTVSSPNLTESSLQQVIPPANDDFANATQIVSLPFSDSVDNTQATIEPNEIQYCYDAPKTVWYSITPTSNMTIIADLAGSSFTDTNITVYTSSGPGIENLEFAGCAIFGSLLTFKAQEGITYYIQASSTNLDGGDLHINLQKVLPPVNDNFSSASVISSLPYTDTINTVEATIEAGEPLPSCISPSPAPINTAWYSFTPTFSGLLTASIPHADFYPAFALYTGNSVSNLTEIGCKGYTGQPLTFLVDSGTTYYFQTGSLFDGESGLITFHLEVTPSPQANFFYHGFPLSRFTTIYFQDISYDPANLGIQTRTWSFGDGATASGTAAYHKYAIDGDYQVTETVTTVDGRTASTAQTLQIRTHDVSITKIDAPNSANAGQTKTISINLKNTNYPETAELFLYKIASNGNQIMIADKIIAVPVLSGNRTTAFNFNYTFTSDDAKVGRVTFEAYISLVDSYDAYPADNKAISTPTKITK